MRLLQMHILIPALIAALVIGINPATAQNQTVGLFTYDTASYDGYTLIAPMSSTTTYLIDNYGRAVHSWESDRRRGGDPQGKFPGYPWSTMGRCTRRGLSVLKPRT